MNKLSLKDFLELEAIMRAGSGRYSYHSVIEELSIKDERGDSGLKRRLRFLRDINNAVDRIEIELHEELANGLTKS